MMDSKTNNTTTPIFGSTQISESALVELLPDFFAEIKEDFRAMTRALTQSEHAEVKALGHKIKGTASSYGAIKVSETALHIQDAAPHIETLKPQVAKLAALIDEAEVYAKENWGI